MLYLREEERKAKLDHIREQKEALEMAECTFAPNTLPAKLNRSHRGFRRRCEDHDIVDRLYAPQKTKYEILEEMKQEREQIKKMKELSQCTFQPKINHNFKSKKM